jgi:hypothetical protein
LGPEKFVETTPKQDMSELTLVNARIFQEQLDDPLRGHEISGQGVMDALDAMYPYRGEQVMVSGSGFHPIVDENGLWMDDEWGHRSGVEGLHEGFFVSDIEEGDTVKRQIMHQIVTDGFIYRVGQTMRRREVVYSRFDLDALVLPINEMETVLGINDQAETAGLEERWAGLMAHSKELVRVYKSTAFRRLNHSKQIEKISSIIHEADKMANLRDKEVALTADYLFVPNMNSIWTLRAPTIGKIVASGLCIGIESIESLSMTYKRVCRDRDLVNKYAGACLVIDPDDETRDHLDLEPENILYVPTANQQLEVIDAT